MTVTVIQYSEATGAVVRVKDGGALIIGVLDKGFTPEDLRAKTDSCIQALHEHLKDFNLL